MGHALAAAVADAGHELAGGIDKGGDVASLADRSDALVDFSAPAALDGNLHAAWVERDDVDGATRLKYGFGRINRE